MSSSWVKSGDEYYLQTLMFWTNNFNAGEYMDIAYMSFCDSMEEVNTLCDTDKVVRVTNLTGGYEIIK